MNIYVCLQLPKKADESPPRSSAVPSAQTSVSGLGIASWTAGETCLSFSIYLLWMTYKADGVCVFMS